MKNLIKNFKGIFALAVLALLTLNQAQARQKSLLWKIEGKNIKTSYLMGTFHLMPQEEFAMKEKVKTAFSQTEQLALELDMDEPGMQNEIMGMMMFTDGKTLKDYMTEEEYEKVKKGLKETTGMELDAFIKMKPLVVTQMMIVSMLGKQPASYEMTFINMAREKEMEVFGLETVAEQMSVFDNVPYEDQLDDVVEMMDDREKNIREFNELIVAYKAEDLNELMKIVETQMDDAKTREVMLFQRNENWIEKMGKLASEKPTFFGVGAAHLPGKRGVINLLRKAGYKVTPVEG